MPAFVVGTRAKFRVGVVSLWTASSPFNIAMEGCGPNLTKIGCLGGPRIPEIGHLGGPTLTKIGHLGGHTKGWLITPYFFVHPEELPSWMEALTD